jgi:hypothetical protein
MIGKTIRGRKVVLALDLKFSGNLKGAPPPQLLYTEDSVRQLIMNDSLKYETSKNALLKEFQELQATSYYIIQNKRPHAK